MKKQNSNALKYTGAGLATVVAVALLVDFIAPDTQTGKLLRFLGPLLAGCISGVWIHKEIASEIDLNTDG